MIFAQRVSELSPTMIVWNLDGNKKASLSKGRYGVKFRDSLSLDVYFSEQTYQRFKNKNVKFEFRWYYYLSTTKSMMYVDKGKHLTALQNGSLFVNSTQKNLKPGWWEVQIYTNYDNALLEIARTTKFQIMISK